MVLKGFLLSLIKLNRRFYFHFELLSLAVYLAALMQDFRNAVSSLSFGICTEQGCPTAHCLRGDWAEGQLRLMHIDSNQLSKYG